MSGFYFLGKLDNFKEIFDIEDYKRNLGKRIGYWFAFEHGGFVKDFKTYANINGANIPFSAYLWCVIFKGYTKLADALKTSAFLRKLYYASRLHILNRKIFSFFRT